MNDEIIKRLNEKYGIRGKVLDFVDGNLIVYANACVFSIDTKTMEVLVYRINARSIFKDVLA